MTHRKNTTLSFMAILALAALLAGCATAKGGKDAPPAVSFKPANGTYTSPQKVELLPADPAAKIYYTVDGSEPSAQEGTKSQTYMKPIPVNKSQTIRAIAVPGSGKPSDIVSATYVVTGTVAAPGIEKSLDATPPAGTTMVKLSTATPEARIRYTLDGSEPTPVYGMEYAGIPAIVKKGMTMKAIAFRSGWKESSVSSKNFDDEAEVQASRNPATAAAPASPVAGMPVALPPSLPRFSPGPGTFQEAVTVSLAAASDVVGIRYTTDGSEPGAGTGTVYSAPFRIESTKTVKAVAVGADSRISSVAVGEFVITGTVASPLVSPAAGTYTPDRTVSMSCATPGAVIRYTMDGSLPSSSRGNLYSSPFQAKGSVTITAIAGKPGWKDSPATAVSYTFVDTPEMVLVQGGTFNMGSASGESDEKPVHPVTLLAFYIGRNEVTQAQYRSIMGSNPSFFKNGIEADSRPVEQVSWFNAVGYCNALSDLAGLPRVYSVSGTTVAADFSKPGYRLPTEAEWEFAARGGLIGTLPGSVVLKYSGSDDADAVSWNSRNSGGGTKPVGTRAANGLGLFDMTGNVWEWCHDWYGIYPALTGKPLVDPKGPASGTMRVKRGGGWNRLPDFARVPFRNYHNPLNNDRTIGFRVARSVLK